MMAWENTICTTDEFVNISHSLSQNLDHNIQPPNVQQWWDSYLDPVRTTGGHLKNDGTFQQLLS